MEQCNLESRCLYWYYGGGNCRLLSDDGKGGEVADGRSYGKKHSDPGKIVLFIQINYYQQNFKSSFQIFFGNILINILAKFPFTGYEELRGHSKDTCSYGNSYSNRISTTVNTNIAKCIKLCNDDYDCHHFFFNNANQCIMYKSCSEWRTPTNTGVTYAKHFKGKTTLINLISTNHNFTRTMIDFILKIY